MMRETEGSRRRVMEVGPPRGFDVPETLRGWVMRDGDILVLLRSEVRIVEPLVQTLLVSLLWMGLTIAVAWWLTVGVAFLVVVVDIFGPELGLWREVIQLLLIVTAGVGSATSLIAGVLRFVWGLVRAFERYVEPLPLHVTRQGLALQCQGGPTVQNPKRVELCGEVGGPLRLTVVGDSEWVVLNKIPGIQRKGWSYNNIYWFAGALAEQLQVPLRDPIVHRVWQRWAFDPSFRLKVQFDAEGKRSQANFPALHQAAPTRPVALRQTFEGWSLFNVRLNSAGIGNLPLHEILEVQVRFRGGPPMGNVGPTGAVALLTAKQIVIVGHRNSDADFAGELRWVADEIRRQVECAEPPVPAGSKSDIPEGLTAMLSD